MERAQSSPQAGTQQSGISSDEVVNPQHYRRLTLRQTMDAEHALLEKEFMRQKQQLVNALFERGNT